MKSFGIITVFIIAFAACNAQSEGVKNLSQKDLANKLKEDNIVLIDVRTPGEVASGYIPESDLFMDINRSDFDQKIAELDTTKTYVMYCRSGARSGRAANKMIALGFSDVYNLSGGILAYKGELKK
jgi:rhodanese-related sulfurtransferase